MSIVSKDDLLRKQAEVKNTLESFTCRILVCSGTGCIASGAQKIYDEMVRLCENLDWVSIEMKKDVPHVGIVKTGFGHSLESACCNIFVNRFCIDVTAVFKNNPGLQR